MDSYELNKIAGAILFTILVVMGIGVLTDMIFATHAPEKPGYMIEVAEAESAGGEAPAAAEETPLPTLLASGDVDKGIGVSKKCAACHTFEEGGANKVGPNLYGIVGRLKGSHEGFKYSSAMMERNGAGETWTYENLNAFLLKPKDYLKGTSMGFAGLKKDGDRADMIVYLRSLAADPVPLPE